MSETGTNGNGANDRPDAGESRANGTHANGSSNGKHAPGSNGTNGAHLANGHTPTPAPADARRLEIIEDILERLAKGETLRAICRNCNALGYPHESSFRRWVTNDDPPGLATRYARARELQVEAMADEIIEIADDGRNDLMTIKRGGEEVEVPDNEVLQRSRLRVDTRKWLMSKIVPKKWGDAVEQSGQSLVVITIDPFKTLRDAKEESFEIEGTNGTH